MVDNAIKTSEFSWAERKIVSEIKKKFLEIQTVIN